MIDKSQIIPTVLDKLKSLPNGHYIDLRTYKRDRSVIILKKDSDRFIFFEDGFIKDNFEVEFVKVKKTLKGLLKKEFPRSNKIRLYNMGIFDIHKTEDIVRKVI